MRFGVAFFPSMAPAAVMEIARLAEELGYQDLWIPDQSFQHDPFVLLAGCAHATSSIRLGVAVTNPLTRHPVQIARAAATLDQLSGGRFVLGLGAGNRTRVLPSLGLPTDRAAARIEEAVDACRRLLAAQHVSNDGPTLSLRDVGLDMDDVRSVPIFVGSRGPRVLRLAGAKADGVFLEAMFTPEGLDYAITEVTRGARSTKRDPSAIELVAWQAMKLSTTMAATGEERYRSWAALLMRGTRDDILERIGVPRATIVSVKEALRHGSAQRAGSMLHDDAVARLVLVGDPDGVEEQLRTVEGRRIDTVAILAFGRTEEVRDTLQRFALDVMARFDRPVDPRRRAGTERQR